MIIADAKFLDSKGAAKFVTPTTTNLMRRLAFLRRPPAPTPRPHPATRAAAPAPATRVASPPPPRPPAARAAGSCCRRASGGSCRAAAPRPCRPRAQRPAAPAAQRPRRPPPGRLLLPPRRTRRRVRVLPHRRPNRPRRPGPRLPPPRAGAPASPNLQQRTSGSADSDSIAFEISDIDPKALLKPQSRQAPRRKPKRPDLRVVQTDRLPKLELPLQADADPRIDLGRFGRLRNCRRSTPAKRWSRKRRPPRSRRSSIRKAT